jgi:proteasome lid subunit RPN8/RPN11
MIALQKKDLETLLAHAERDYPNECCGLLLGRISGNRHEVTEVSPVVNNFNDDEKHHRFEISADVFFQAEKKARASGVELLGFYHSHPDCPEIPSEYDREHAMPVYSYIIASVVKGKAAGWRSWVLKSGRDAFEEEEREVL